MSQVGSFKIVKFKSFFFTTYATTNILILVTMTTAQWMMPVLENIFFSLCNLQVNEIYLTTNLTLTL